MDAEDFSALTSASKMPDEKLAKLTCHFLVCRCDGQAKDTRYDLCMLPCPSNGKTDLFYRILGMCMEALTLSNGNVPPLGFAVDGGSTNQLALRAGLGLIDTKLLTGAFWGRCSLRPLVAKIPYFCFQQLVYDKAWPVLTLGKIVFSWLVFFVLDKS